MKTEAEMDGRLAAMAKRLADETQRANAWRDTAMAWDAEISRLSGALAKDRELLEIARSSIELLRGQLADAKQALAEEQVKSDGLSMTCIHHEADLAQSQAREASLVAALSDCLPIVLNSPKDHTARIFTCAQQALARHQAAKQEGKQ